MLAAKQVLFVVLLQCVLLSHANPLPLPLSQQILVVHINESVSNTSGNDHPLYESIKVTNPNLDTLCTIYRNETNHQSFTSLYLTGYDPNSDLTANDIVSFHHIIDINDIPLSCIHKPNHITSTKQIKNTIKYTQTPIDFMPGNENINKVFVDVDPQNLHVSQCPTETWQYFVWSLKEWWLIYLCVVSIGILIGALLMNIIIFCCWRSMKKKYATKIINDYKKQIMFQQESGICNSHQIHIVHQNNGRKYKYNEHIEYTNSRNSRSNSRRKKHKKMDRSQKPKYALVARNDSKEDKDHKSRKRNKRQNHLRPYRSASDQAAEQNASEEEDKLLQVSSRMKSNSDPFNPHHKGRRSRSNRRKHRSKSRPRSKSPYPEKKRSAQRLHDESYRFQGNGDILLQPEVVYDYDADKRRHSSKSKKHNKNRKKNIDKKQNKNDMKDDAQVCDGNVTKKSIGINLARMKAKNYEENRREAMPANQVGVKAMSSVEMHHMTPPITVTVVHADDNITNDMIIHEGVSADRNGRKQGHFRNGGDSNYMSSLTNVNDEGMAAIENILSEMKEMNSRNLIENEESSSFTMKSADAPSSNENAQQKDEEDVKVNKDGDALMTTMTKGAYRLPKAKTKGGWL